MAPALRIGTMLLALALAGGVAEARVKPSPWIAVAQDFVALEEVLDQLRADYPGHQLSVSGPTDTGNGYVYEIKWLTDEGAVLYVTVDAETGAILSVDGG